MSEPPATLAPRPLLCPYCDGEVTPLLEYTTMAYSEHRDWTATECDDCPATWEKDGQPATVPTQEDVAYVRERRARMVERRGATDG